MTVPRASLVQIASKRIKQHIVKNAYEAGDKYLTEKALTERLQVSRTVIREALISLESVGLLTIVSGDGVYIADPNVQPMKKMFQHYDDLYGVKLKELIEIRKVIELGAIRLIVEKNLVIDLQQFRLLNEQYYSDIIEGKDTRSSDRAFHQFLIQSTENETFHRFSEVIHEYFTTVHTKQQESKQALLRSYQEHEKMIQQLEKKQMVEAQAMMINHLQPLFTFVDTIERED